MAAALESQPANKHNDSMSEAKTGPQWDNIAQSLSTSARFCHRQLFTQQDRGLNSGRKILAGKVEKQRRKSPHERASASISAVWSDQARVSQSVCPNLSRDGSFKITKTADNNVSGIDGGPNLGRRRRTLSQADNWLDFLNLEESH